MIIIKNGERRVFDVKANELMKISLRRELSALENYKRRIDSWFNEVGIASQMNMLEDLKQIEVEKAEIKAKLREISSVKP